MKYTLTISTEEHRAKAFDWLKRVPVGWVLTLQEARRSTAQNDLMWSLLSEISAQRKHAGMKLEPEVWKAVFLHELGIECKFIPSLHGNSVLPLGYRSSKLSKAQMAALIDIILKWGAENGVVFGDERRAA